ncbi:hypothetical protein [Pelagibacterium limicola]|uniref:hypothetical protein n=1 Tax=Pelagibacterium limicola TaxID=2791022 RepID=UPI0018AF7034|nr:hypothetical protein [Pelagibacterium limicola]
MQTEREIDIPEKALCGQADAVLDILGRTGSLPTELSLTIEEILERAWEIAYRRRDGGMATVTDLATFRAMREQNGRTRRTSLAGS